MFFYRRSHPRQCPGRHISSSPLDAKNIQIITKLYDKNFNDQHKKIELALLT